MPSPAPTSTRRLRLAIRGAVQGVGFRPFIYRLATELGLRGWVNNSAQGVFIEVEGPPSELEKLLLRVGTEKPPRSFIQSLEPSWLDPVGYTDFEIRESEAGGSKTALVLPDIATCPDCLREIFDPNDRRYFYPFTNCTNCGPRFSIIESLPYDRANTSMKVFPMCPQCRAEYENPRDRRFHAQPNACPVCGPRLELWDSQGARAKPGLASFELLCAAADFLRAGKILAVKGLGGFHLMVAAQNDQAVQRLRQLKHREEKPFALMFPSLQSAKEVCEVSPLEERLLLSPEAPIVLLRRHPIRNTQHATPDSPHASRLTPHVSSFIAPNNPNLGVLLPYTPLHHLLLSVLGEPVVATSGNLSDEPICIDEHEALQRLAGIADFFLVHNRPIVRHVDDSIVRIVAERELVLRRARGYAPLPIQLPAAAGGGKPASQSVLAVGAHLKNAVALSVGSQAFLSQHIGDLETDQAFEAFRRVIRDLEQLYESPPALVAADAHPDYLSTRFARDQSQRVIAVQHHLAHVLSCMAENELEPPVLGVSWDGTGYGLDGTVWGGEFFLITAEGCERVAHLRPFRLPGGDKAVREPRRTALGLLYAAYGEAALARQELAPLRAFSPAELASLKTMLARRLNSPLTSSAGRLFDAVAALAGLRQLVRFEGQAAMELEFALEGSSTDEAYPLPLSSPAANGARNTQHAPQPSPATNAAASPHASRVTHHVLDWSPLLESLLADVAQSVPVAQLSAKFHNALAEGIVLVARSLGQKRVALSGGCFQNRYLTERTIRRLREEGFSPYWHQRVPPNDGGIALGQIAAGLRACRTTS